MNSDRNAYRELKNKGLKKALKIAKKETHKAPYFDENNIVHEFSDGYFWYFVARPEECEWEGKMMNHCGAGDGRMYSLRDPENEPHVTVDVVGGEANMIRGKNNREPNRKYWDYVQWLVGDFDLVITDPEISSEASKYFTEKGGSIGGGIDDRIHDKVDELFGGPHNGANNNPDIIHGWTEASDAGGHVLMVYDVPDKGIRQGELEDYLHMNPPPVYGEVFIPDQGPSEGMGLELGLRINDTNDIHDMERMVSDEMYRWAQEASSYLQPSS